MKYYRVRVSSYQHKLEMKSTGKRFQFGKAKFFYIFQFVFERTIDLKNGQSITFINAYGICLLQNIDFIGIPVTN